jgi:small-conductance mechanosensitive channel
MSELTPLVMSVIGGLAGLAALLKVFVDARKDKRKELQDARALQPSLAEAYERMATKQAEQIENLRGRVARLEEELREQDVYVDGLLEGISMLVGQLCEANIKPKYAPRSRRAEIQQIP